MTTTTTTSTSTTATSSPTSTTSTSTSTSTTTTTLPSVSFSAANQTVAESAGAVTVTVNLSQIWGVNVQVPYTVSGTAANPADHNLANDTLTILAGDTSEDIVFNVVNDADVEMTETVVITIGVPVNAVAAAPSVHTVNVTSEELPTVFFDTRGQTGAEDDGTVTVQASLSAPISSNVTVPVTYTGMATNPADYTAAASFVITAGNSTGSLVVTLVDDTVEEKSEPLVLTMGVPTNATRVDAASHRIDITDTDNCSATETGTIYYVDSTDGNDGNSGTTPADAWQTIGKVNGETFNPGDKVLFQRGEIWRGATLTFPSSGANGNPIVIGAYGCGDKPSLRGSFTLNTAGNWTDTGGNIWRYDGQNVFGSTCVFTHDGTLGLKNNGACTAGLSTQWEYCADAGDDRLYVYSAANPATLAAELAVSDDGILVVVSIAEDYITIKDLDVREVAHNGFGVEPGTSVNFDNIDLKNIHRTAIAYGAGASGSIRNCSILNYNVRSTFWDGIGLYGDGTIASAGPVDIENCTITQTHNMASGAGDDPSAIVGYYGWPRNVRWNTIVGNGGMLFRGIGAERLPVFATSVAIEDNVIDEPGTSGIRVIAIDFNGASLPVTVRRNRVTGACSQDEPGTASMRLTYSEFYGGTVPIDVSHNIIDGTVNGVEDHPAVYVEEAYNISFANNVVYGADDGIQVNSGGPVVLAARNNIIASNRGWGYSSVGCCGPFFMTSDYNDFHSNASGDYQNIAAGADDMTNDPLFTNAAAGDFTLQGTSTLIDAGTVIGGLTRDINHNPLPLGAAIDIGAHEQ